ncbi:putative receptor-like protein kinase [Dorcoceras hygrometricum]|uniref:non-specific serine/threonine protein kinase n=1 Tax=Dorcoceras hygrometricum TaxID=472368 RepID=A0A2Z7CIL1_9LAMI|nr:putative receptor-like protein kinase [Dorcoceras hygrometricum]
MGSSYNSGLSKETNIFHLKVWALVGICFCIFAVLVLLVLWCFVARKKFRTRNKHPVSWIPNVSKEIKEIRVDQNSTNHFDPGRDSLSNGEKYHEKNSDKLMTHPSNGKETKSDGRGQSGSFTFIRSEDVAFESVEKKGSPAVNPPCSHTITLPSPLAGLPELSQLDWGHWFTLRDLEIATNKFSKENVIGEGGYGVVYRGQLTNGAIVAVKRLLNNLGQAEKEFRVEVEAIGHVRHKNLVRLLGYCIEGTHRLLVYEYVKNGNLEQWLHGAMSQHGYLTWEGRMKILRGTAKALAYLHEAIDPKVVHRDIKSSNILIDDDFNAKISDFGLAKLLGAGETHIITRVMGTFGYVAPEYASSGFLNEKSDVYSFGVLLLEAITGREPADDSRPLPEKNLVDWIKMMVGARRSEEVLDPNIYNKPSKSAFKRALLTALRCVDPNVEQRPPMSQVVRMLESEEYPIPREGRKKAKESFRPSLDAEQIHRY